MSHVGYVTIVSGLPRSGTSMLMQMLAAGGIEPLTDGQRAPDDDNPRGYYEHDAVRSLASHPDLLVQAQGKAVKVIAALVPQIPVGPSYRVLLIRRSIDEVIASQRTMLERMGRPPVPLTDAQLAGALESQLRAAVAWCTHSPHVELLELQHRRLCTEPAPASQEIAAFLERDLDVAAMADAVVPTLYRQRHARSG